VNKQTRQMLNDAEQELLRATEPDRLKRLDEDDLLDLHGRIRRARNKYTKLYRRRSAARVEKDSSRAMASAANRRSAVKAEVFEEALARVSRRLAREAWLSADRLREERLAAARAAKSAKAVKGSAKGSGKGSKKSKAKGKASTGKARAAEQRRTPSSTRDAAASRAATRRKQAKRDAR
jgi:hypothetical protein